MIDIENIKKEGAIAALKEKIRVLQFRVSTSAWSNTMKKNHYYRLHEAIADAYKTLYDIEVAFAALQELEPENK